ncbi:hypothetical protein [Cellulosimicrobium sp. JZ28]|uniref:hypothetical protein n=1 Tax=Cellulosimicrobium sp. JZ28 TaxID=1906273 RepID=UPI00188AB35D|nr:hypothetical protein [Cellulosimicrobium sp. JZ28]
MPPTRQEAAAARAAAAKNAEARDRLSALEVERQGYVQRDDKKGVAAVDEEIAHWSSQAGVPLDSDPDGDDEDANTAEAAELRASVDELTATVDELTATVDELIDRNAQLVAQNSELTVENERLRGLVPDAPPADSTAPAPATPDPSPADPEPAKAEAPKGRQRRSAAAAAEPKAD